LGPQRAPKGAPLGPLLGPFWGPSRAPPGPLIFPLSFCLRAFGPENRAENRPKRALFGPFWPVFRPSVSGCFPCLGFGGPAGPGLPGPPPWGLAGPLGPGFGSFWGRFWPLLGALFWPRFWVVFVLWGVLAAGSFGPFSGFFWALFGPRRGPKPPPKALGFQPGLCVPVGFRVKSPFSATSGAKVGQSGSNGAFGGRGQAGVYYKGYMLRDGALLRHVRVLHSIGASTGASLALDYYMPVLPHLHTLSFLSSLSFP